MIDASAEGNLNMQIESLKYVWINTKKNNFYLRGFKWVFWREMDVQKEHSSLVDRSGWTQNGGDPLVNVVPFGSGAEEAKKFNK